MECTPNPSSEEFSESYDNSITIEPNYRHKENIYDLVVKAKELYDIIISYAEHNDLYLLDHPNSYQDFLELYVSHCL